MIPDEILTRLAQVRTHVCWHVGAGGSVGSSFSLALGAKVPRERPLRHVTEDGEWKIFEGEFRFLVWCTWRLETSAGPVASSDQQSEHTANALQLLCGTTLLEATVNPPAWDLTLHFSGGARLSIFCDHLRGDASIEQNWELWCGREALLIGPGYEWNVHRET